MKSYTDLEQSTKLAMILPLESADMRYHTISHYNPYPCDEIVYTIEFNRASGKDIPCWSLAKLCELMEVEYKIEKTYLDQSDFCTYSFIFEGFPDGQPGYYRTYEREEMIDAAVEFIEFLKRNELL